ncbi:MAG: glutamine synthetase [Clostridia bacterium]|nr:glutamine synthetase [Clostridia bacterium]
MKYTKQEVLQFVEEEDVKFIRLAFCDVFGKQKNISIMPGELERAFKYGIAIDAWSIAGSDESIRSDLFLHPDPSTLSVLPWRPDHGRVVRMFCAITWLDGTPFEGDTRHLLISAVQEAETAGYTFHIGAEAEFYLFKLDDHGNETHIPYDHAGYMDIAPEDKGENIRREICLTLEQMGIYPESSHHEEGPGQNEIDFRYSDPLTAADNTVTFCTVVRTIANRNGIYADFTPKPLRDLPGNGMHVNFSVHRKNAVGNALLQESDDTHLMQSAIAGVLHHIEDMTVFLNPCDASYERLGCCKAPRYITWSHENRSQLIRIPAALNEFRRAELRSPDPSANPYIAYTLLIYACLDGIQNNIVLPEPANINFYHADKELQRGFRSLPASLREASRIAQNSAFIHEHLPAMLISAYTGQ